MPKKNTTLDEQSVNAHLMNLKKSAKEVRDSIYQLEAGDAHIALGLPNFSTFMKQHLEIHLSRSAIYQILREAKIEARVLGPDRIGSISSTNLRKLDEFEEDSQAALWERAREIGSTRKNSIPTTKDIVVASKRLGTPNRKKKEVRHTTKSDAGSKDPYPARTILKMIERKKLNAKQLQKVIRGCADRLKKLNAKRIRNQQARQLPSPPTSNAHNKPIHDIHKISI